MSGQRTRTFHSGAPDADNVRDVIQQLVVDAREPTPELGGENGGPEVSPIVPHQPRPDASNSARGMTTSPRLRCGAGVQHTQRAQRLLDLTKPSRENLPCTGGRLNSRAIGADLAHRRLQDEGGALGTPGCAAALVRVERAHVG